MSVFAELFARYQEKVMELCVDEASDDGRLFCFFPDAREYYENPQDYRCLLCERRAFDNGGFYNDPLNHTCDSNECRELYAWHFAAKADGGYIRRQTFRGIFRKNIREMDHALRKNAILTTMLVVNAKEKANERQNIRRAA